MPDRIPVLIDTDPGSDIDDVLALAYLLRQPRCELVGVTTVTGDVAKRAAIVEVVCRAYGREDIPIHAGIVDTLADGPGQPLVPHYDAISHLPHRTDYPANTAVDFLRETIRSRPGEIVLLSIGPFGNIANLFALDPEIPSLLRGFVSMAGHFFGSYAEWNCRCDPAAAVAAIKRAQAQTMIGLDVTMKCQMDPEDVRRHFNHPPHDVLLAMAEKWFQSAERITFHDPLAAAVIFEPELCSYRSGRVTEGGESGSTMLEEGDGPHRVAESVDSERFFRHYFKTLDISATAAPR